MIIDQIKNFFRHKLKIRGIFPRFILILFLPIILIQLINAYVFYDRHWENVANYLVVSVSYELEYIKKLLESREYEQASIAINAFGMMQIDKMSDGISASKVQQDLNTLNEFLKSRISKDAYSILNTKKKRIEVYMPVDGTDYYLTFGRKRIISPTTYIYTISLVITAVVIFIISFIFLKNQVRNIIRLADAAEDFGKTGKLSKISISGPFEIRKLIRSFLMMQERISRQITHRRELLSHISHDLRTPLTRLKLKLEMMQDSRDIRVIKNEINEMQRMLDTYLEFAKAEGNEVQKVINLKNMIARLIKPFDTKKACFKNELGDIKYSLKPIAFERAVNNLLDNAFKYAKSEVNVTLTRDKKQNDIVIMIEDDGDGIKSEEISKITEPFVKGDGSQSHGLGLAIVKSIVQSQGGELSIGRSEQLGGLRIEIALPD